MTEEPSRLQSMWLQKVGCDLATEKQQQQQQTSTLVRKDPYG